MNIVRKRMTISLTEEERKAMQPIIDRAMLTPHAFVKACLRYVLFPKERERMPIDGYISMKETKRGIVIGEAKKMKIVKEPERDIFKEIEKEELAKPYKPIPIRVPSVHMPKVKSVSLPKVKVEKI